MGGGPVERISAEFYFWNLRKLIDVEQLDCESAFFWQHLVEYLNRNDEYSEKLDAILPELVDLVDVIYE